ncbi:MAG TPA: hypothetical protein DCY25_03145 [Bacteroidales bacterium]|nr:hypothetical protein [Bacteroidales bacterium]
MKKLIVVMLGLVLTVLFLSAAFAEIRTDYLTVSATLVPSCTVSATSINFGDTGGAEDVFANGSVTVNCDSGTTYEIGLNEGLHYIEGGYFWRCMESNSHLLQYRLYISDPGNYLYEWGNTCSTNTYNKGVCNSGTGTGANQEYIVYGLVNSFYSMLPPGVYTDTVTVEVVY